MIKKLKIKFIVLSMSALLILLVAVIVGMNLMNFVSSIHEADTILDILSDNKGRFPDMGDGRGGRLPHGISPELPYESRYFSVLLSDDGTIIQTDTSRIISIDSKKALDYTENVLKSKDAQGFVGDFRYLVIRDGDIIRVVFLDWGRRIDSLYSFFISSVIMAFVGYAAVLVAVFFLAERIIKPVSESYEKQKRFITDAGHEIKTPITIINANIDLLEMDVGKNEFVDEIRSQSARLGDLTGNLVYLAKMEETEKNVKFIDFPISDVIEETVSSFKAICKTNNKLFVCGIEPMLSMKGDPKAIERLVCVLMDNAIKYSPDGGRIELTLRKHGKSICLSIYNTTKDIIKVEDMSHMFERFWRADPSRNSSNGGYGIGLSIAKAIADAHNGKINAATEDMRSIIVSVSFQI